eukprot:TRINITY_DN29003_c0_g1_i1.p1 TRINITY_DN29003_c0_g1~~TRINITY_DN29003_c0_g1_i1.p1  ORF type:complete len:621 (-),score=25.45 TRINITY_DN29003_c0_g1_i1:215-2077(-)
MANACCPSRLVVIIFGSIFICTFTAVLFIQHAKRAFWSGACPACPTCHACNRTTVGACTACPTCQACNQTTVEVCTQPTVKTVSSRTYTQLPVATIVDAIAHANSTPPPPFLTGRHYLYRQHALVLASPQLANGADTEPLQLQGGEKLVLEWQNALGHGCNSSMLLFMVTLRGPEVHSSLSTPLPDCRWTTATGPLGVGEYTVEVSLLVWNGDVYWPETIPDPKDGHWEGVKPMVGTGIASNHPDPRSCYFLCARTPGCRAAFNNGSSRNNDCFLYDHQGRWLPNSDKALKYRSYTIEGGSRGRLPEWFDRSTPHMLTQMLNFHYLWIRQSVERVYGTGARVMVTEGVGNVAATGSVRLKQCRDMESADDPGFWRKEKVSTSKASREGIGDFCCGNKFREGQGRCHLTDCMQKEQLWWTRKTCEYRFISPPDMRSCFRSAGIELGHFDTDSVGGMFKCQYQHAFALGLDVNRTPFHVNLNTRDIWRGEYKDVKERTIFFWNWQILHKMWHNNRTTLVPMWNKQLEQVDEQLHNLPTRRFFLLSTPLPSERVPNDHTVNALFWNKIFRETLAPRGFLFIDLFSLVLPIAETDTCSFDGMHPTAPVYRMALQQVVNTICDID